MRSLWCICVNGCQDCPGDDGFLDRCSGCAHKRRVTSVDVDKLEETLEALADDLINQPRTMAYRTEAPTSPPAKRRFWRWHQ